MQHQWQQTTSISPPRRGAPGGTALDTHRLCAITRAVAAAEPRWRALVRHDPCERWYIRLSATVAAEVWLLTWTTEQGVALHDHGGSSGVFMVVEGELTEDFTDLTTHAPVRRAQRRAGTLHTFGPGHVHDLRNTTSGGATSIHVYSPPLSAMTFYEPNAGGRLAPVRMETVTPAEPALPVVF